MKTIKSFIRFLLETETITAITFILFMTMMMFAITPFVLSYLFEYLFIY